MASYEYLCGTCGPWDVQLPIGTADSARNCPACGVPGRRRFTPPRLRRTPRAVGASRAREEASRDAPAVVAAVPPAARRATPTDHRWNALPRP